MNYVKIWRALVKSKHDDSITSVNTEARINNNYDQLNNKYNSLNNDYTNVKNENATSKSDYNTLKNKYDQLNGDYDRLKKEYAEYKLSKAVPDAETSTPVDNNSLRLNLVSSKNEDIPDNLMIFLIPDVSANKKIIRESKVYDNHFDFASLKKAQGVKTAIFNDIGYSFPNVSPGDYFIKICAYYGPYKMITKKSVGNETAPKIDISEILR